MTKEETIRVVQYESEILNLIDNQDKFTRGDLQGQVQAIVMKIIGETRSQG